MQKYKENLCTNMTVYNCKVIHLLQPACRATTTKYESRYKYEYNNKSQNTNTKQPC